MGKQQRKAMRNKIEIDEKIKDLISEIEELYKERDENKEKYGGINEEDNESFFSDVSWRRAKIEGLLWVLNSV